MLAVVAVLGIPLGVGLLLSILLLSLIGVVVTAQTVGRRLLDRDRRTATAFLAGWAIETAIGVIPYVSGAVYAAAAVFGLGATTVAVWRARGPRRGAKPAGKHRAGAAGAIQRTRRRRDDRARTRPGAVRLPVSRERCRGGAGRGLPAAPERSTVREPHDGVEVAERVGVPPCERPLDGGHARRAACASSLRTRAASFGVPADPPGTTP